MIRNEEYGFPDPEPRESISSVGTFTSFGSPCFDDSFRVSLNEGSNEIDRNSRYSSLSLLREEDDEDGNNGKDIEQKFDCIKNNKEMIGTESSMSDNDPSDPISSLSSFLDSFPSSLYVEKSSFVSTGLTSVAEDHEDDEDDEDDNDSKYIQSKFNGGKDNKEMAATEFCSSSYRNDDFFADSPYFDTFVNKEINTATLVKDYMNDIARKTEEFSDSGLQMAKATRKLASSCRLDATTDSTDGSFISKEKLLEPEVADGLKLLGDVFDEIASAQEILSKFLSFCMISNVHSLVKKQSLITRMRDEAENETNEAEDLFTKYLHSGKGSWGEMDRGAAQVARRKRDLVRVRVAQTSAELKRYQLVKNVVDFKYHQNLDISNCASEMVVQMRSYYSHSSDLLEKLGLRMTNIREKCKEICVKNRNRHWEDREKVLDNTLQLARQTGFFLEQQVKSISCLPQSELDSVSCEFDLEEESAQLWDLPVTLASYAGHRRPMAEGVLAEGWLYKKNNDMSSLSLYRNHATSWSRSWFLVRKDGIFNLTPTKRYRNSFTLNSSDHTTDSNVNKMGVCDLQLCSVRKLEENSRDPSTRFCFELITPSDYKNRLVLQARGPFECEMWLDAIQLGITSQLAAVGKGPKLSKTQSKRSPRRSIMVGRYKTLPDNENFEPRRSSEIASTVLKRGRSLFASDVTNFLDETCDDLTPEMKKLAKANPTCADCEEDFPDWVSLNLGIVICLKCSGIHRSLGVHISKVRSLKLDALSDRELNLLLSLGNARANQLWEAEVPLDHLEQREADPENWIRRKYIHKEFIGANSPNGRADEDSIMSRNLYEASKQADLIGIAKAIIHGGNVNWKNSKEESKTALSVCGIGVQNDHQVNGKTVECCAELLLQNGACEETQVSK